jgi:general secretion pathway protein L
VALLVPAADVTLFALPLPAGNEARLQQLAPFALEEQVSEDVELLHFAVGARDAQGGQVPVAVVNRDRMQQWLAQAAELGLEPRAMFAESDLAPLLPGHVTLLFTDGQLLLRDDRARPMALPAEDPELALAALLGAERVLADTHLAVYASPEDWPRHEAAIESLRERVASLKVQLFAGGALGLYAQGIASTAPVNLLQGEFKPQTKSGNTWRRWRLAAGLLAGLLVLHAAGTLFELRQLRQASAELDESIARVYGTIFPGQQPGPAPRRALEGRLREVAGASSPQGELMPLLAALAAARANVPVAALDSLSYKPGTLQLKLSAPDAATLEQFSQALRAGGYGAQVTSGNARDGRFEAQIDMTAAGS